MTYFTVFTRGPRPTPASEPFYSIELAAKWIRARMPQTHWAVKAQDGSKTANYRDLRRTEAQRLDRLLYPDAHPDHI